MYTYIIVISGPTASGKTQKAVKLCKEYNGEIISCDSRQIYKYLDIGTNKKGILIDNGIRLINGIKQYLVDIIEPHEYYDAMQYVNNADKCIAHVLKHGKIPIVTGGCGLYIKALLYGLDHAPTKNIYLRNQLYSRSYDELYTELKSLDPEAASRTKKNPQRIVRALEINLLTKKNTKELFKIKNRRYNFIHYHIVTNKDTLYDRINTRCKNMLDSGMINETKKVLNMGFKKDSAAMSSLGYKHIVQYLDNKLSKNDLLREFSKDTRHYAKRQITWFKKQPDIEFIFENTNIKLHERNQFN
ncbi:MAG: tRNA (adenosine(37)-N6)-dimethylallyltransferase MiaA [Endomicrobium sp.]|jgi:tRNA dimethylallyltransferase|nr:tRNA (adenosine(37)-N6)-dimethylallyltransferase MiaA [Endomicrobium sp.]